MSLIPTDIKRSMGMHISKICPFSIAKNNSENHCAHYVSHMMGYELQGPTCKNATWADKQKRLEEPQSELTICLIRLWLRVSCQANRPP